MELLTFQEANLIARLFGARHADDLLRIPSEQMLIRRIVVAGWIVAVMRRDPMEFAAAAIEAGTTTPVVHMMAGMNGSARQFAHDCGGDVWRVIAHVAKVGLDVVLSDVRRTGLTWMYNVRLATDEFLRVAEEVDKLFDFPKPNSEYERIAQFKNSLHAASDAAKRVTWEQYTSPQRFARLAKRGRNFGQRVELKGIDIPWSMIELIIDMVALHIPNNVRALAEDYQMRFSISSDAVVVTVADWLSVGERPSFVVETKPGMLLPAEIAEDPPIAALALGRPTLVADGVWAFFAPTAERGEIERAIRELREAPCNARRIGNRWFYDAIGAYYDERCADRER